MSIPLRACRPRLTAAQGPRVKRRASCAPLGAQPLRGYEGESKKARARQCDAQSFIEPTHKHYV